MRVLVVEDEEKLAGLIRRGLTRHGLTVDVTAAGEDALWMAGSTPYDAIVLDVNLPGIDGFEVCRRLRADDVWAPVLMLTARDAVEDRVAGLDGGGPAGAPLRLLAAPAGAARGPPRRSRQAPGHPRARAHRGARDRRNLRGLRHRRSDAEGDRRAPQPPRRPLRPPTTSTRPATCAGTGPRARCARCSETPSTPGGWSGTASTSPRPSTPGRGPPAGAGGVGDRLRGAPAAGLR